MNLNAVAKASYETAKKRQENGAHLSVKTRDMLKHCASEAYSAPAPTISSILFVGHNTNFPP